MCINGCCLFRIYEKLCCFCVGKYNLVSWPDQINRKRLILPISTIRKTKVLRIVMAKEEKMVINIYQKGQESERMGIDDYRI